VKCSDLYDDDIADDVRCATKILESHGVEGWGYSESFCQPHVKKVKDCLETVDEFEDEIELMLVTNVTIPGSKPIEMSTKITPASFKTEIPNVEFPQLLSNQHKKESSFWNASTFFIVVVLVLIVITISIVYMRYHKNQRYFRATFTDAVQLV
jgi:hypothetical protein